MARHLEGSRFQVGWLYLMSGEGGTLIIMGTRGGIWEHTALVGTKSQAGALHY